LRAMTRYRRIDTSTLEGLKAAERLHARGWRMISVGLFTILFESPKGGK